MVTLKAPRDFKEYGVATNGGRPVGTTAEKGYGVSTREGRPVGTTAKKGYGVSQGRLLVPHKRRGLVQVGGGYQTTNLANTLNSEELIYQSNGTHLRIKLTLHLTYWNAMPNVLCNNDVLTRSH